MRCATGGLGAAAPAVLLECHAVLTTTTAAVAAALVLHECPLGLGARNANLHWGQGCAGLCCKQCSCSLKISCWNHTVIIFLSRGCIGMTRRNTATYSNPMAPHLCPLLYALTSFLSPTPSPPLPSPAAAAAAAHSSSFPTPWLGALLPRHNIFLGCPTAIHCEAAKPQGPPERPQLLLPPSLLTFLLSPPSFHLPPPSLLPPSSFPPSLHPSYPPSLLPSFPPSLLPSFPVPVVVVVVVVVVVC